MKAAQIIHESIDPSWGPVGVQAVESLEDTIEAMERDLGDLASDRARERYEAAVVEEARAIVAGTSQAPPTLEHLRLVLEALDWVMGVRRFPDEGAPSF
jgi:hypothetical protein